MSPWKRACVDLWKTTLGSREVEPARVSTNVLEIGDEKMDYHTDQSIESVEKNHILNVLQKRRWNISAAARVLGIDRVTVYKKLEKYGITRPNND